MKERLVGAAVLVIIAVIFIPMLLDDSTDDDTVITRTNIPPVPDSIPAAPGKQDFSSRIIPLEPEVPVEENDETDKPQDSSPVIENLDKQDADTVEPEKSGSETDSVDIELPSTVGLSAWVVQLGSFSSKENAESLNTKLKNAGYRSFVEPLTINDDTVFRVRVGPELKREDAETIKDRLNQAMELKGIVVEYP